LVGPVLTGTVESIAHPGQNVTGTWIAGDDALVGKRLELLKEAVPGVMRVAVCRARIEKEQRKPVEPLENGSLRG
jgi:ABC-type uncharacterized transport system substrate-binding protein